MKRVGARVRGCAGAEVLRGTRVHGCGGARVLQGARVLRGLAAAVTVMLVAFVPVATARAQQQQQQQQQQQHLPAGPGREIVVQRCLSCHEADLIAQQRLSRSGWARTVDKMVRWGARLDSGERDPMLDYLAAHFTPQPVSAHIVATAASEAVYKGACLSCHEDDLIESQRLSRAGWARTVNKMIGWGAKVTPEETDPLIDYLAARYPPR